MNEGFTPSDWLTRLLTSWPTPLTLMILTTPLTHTLLGWRFVSASRWQTWVWGTPLQPGQTLLIQRPRAELGRQRSDWPAAAARVQNARPDVSGSWIVPPRWTCHLNYSAAAQEGGGSTSSPPRCSVSVCVREGGMSEHLAWLQINENHCGLKFVWNRYAQNLASQLQLTKCQVLSGFSFFLCWFSALLWFLTEKEAKLTVKKKGSNPW